MTTKERDSVMDLLLKPIQCSKKYSQIKLVDGVIQTPQRYYCDEDMDMSDFAVGFYEVLYGHLVQQFQIDGLLDKKGRLHNPELAGDTMNSFNTLANIILGDENQHNRSDMHLWPEYLLTYYNRYHCLANFWLIPMRHGRRSAKLNRFDSLDAYVSYVLSHYDILQHETSKNNPDNLNYFQCIEMKAFCKTHFISPPAPEKDYLKHYRNKSIDGCKLLIDEAMCMMKHRADAIAQDDEAGNKLLQYFISLRLIQ